jgi:transcriptional regulator of aromatic amino acid metabolism
VVRGNYDHIANLKRLEKFKYVNSSFSIIEQVLREIGKQLLCLNLIDVSGTDFAFIGRNCLSLECLHLCFNAKEFLILPVDILEVKPDFAFRNVTSLKLHLGDLRAMRYILLKICDIKKLVMTYVFEGGADDEIFKSILQRQWLKKLEELHWRGNLVVKLSETVYTIHQFHPNLNVSVEHIRMGC